MDRANRAPADWRFSLPRHRFSPLRSPIRPSVTSEVRGPCDWAPPSQGRGRNVCRRHRSALLSSSATDAALGGRESDRRRALSCRECARVLTPRASSPAARQGRKNVEDERPVGKFLLRVDSGERRAERHDEEEEEEEEDEVRALAIERAASSRRRFIAARFI